MHQKNKLDFEKEEFNAWGGTFSDYTLDHFVDLLNGITNIESVREDLKSFRNTEYYTGTNKKYEKKN